MDTNENSKNEDFLILNAQKRCKLLIEELQANDKPKEKEIPWLPSQPNELFPASEIEENFHLSLLEEINKSTEELNTCLALIHEEIQATQEEVNQEIQTLEERRNLNDLLRKKISEKEKEAEEKQGKQEENNNFGMNSKVQEFENENLRLINENQKLMEDLSNFIDNPNLKDILQVFFLFSFFFLKIKKIWKRISFLPTIALIHLYA